MLIIVAWYNERAFPTVGFGGRDRRLGISKPGKNRKAGRKPGTPKTGGRQRGSLNKRTIAVKEAVKFVAEQLDGPQAMFEWVRKNDENEKIFWSVMFMKLC